MNLKGFLERYSCESLITPTTLEWFIKDLILTKIKRCIKNKTDTEDESFFLNVTTIQPVCHYKIRVT